MRRSCCQWLVLVGMLMAGLAWAQPETVCVLQVEATGETLLLVSDGAAAVLVPGRRQTQVPIPCADRSRLAVLLANQETLPVTLSLAALTAGGEPLCQSGPFTLAVNGGRGVSLGSCR